MIEDLRPLARVHFGEAVAEVELAKVGRLRDDVVEDFAVDVRVLGERDVEAVLELHDALAVVVADVPRGEDGVRLDFEDA